MFGECLQAIGGQNSLPISLFIGGLVGSFTHCIGMCTPFVLAQAGPDISLRKAGSTLLLPYHLGRMTTYVALAILVYGVVNLAFLFSDLKSLIAAPMLATAAVMFLSSIFPAIAATFPWVSRIRIALPISVLKFPVINLTSMQGPLAHYGLGVLLGFMPCGLVIAALMASATASSMQHAALAMASFTLGTMPALFVVSIGGSPLKNKFPKAQKQLSQGAMVISVLWLFVLAGTMIL